MSLGRVAAGSASVSVGVSAVCGLTARGIRDRGGHPGGTPSFLRRTLAAAAASKRIVSDLPHAILTRRACLANTVPSATVADSVWGCVRGHRLPAVRLCHARRHARPL